MVKLVQIVLRRFYAVDLLQDTCECTLQPIFLFFFCRKICNAKSTPSCAKIGCADFPLTNMDGCGHTLKEIY